MLSDIYRLNILPRSGEVPALPNVEQLVTIPKIIHQTNSSRNWPEIIEKNVSKLREMNSDWEYRFYNSAARRDYISIEFGCKVLELYDKIDDRYAAAQADLFRYLLMYKEGGIYLDIKSGTSAPLSEMLDFQSSYILSFWPNRQGDQYDTWGIHAELAHLEHDAFQQWNIICAPGHPFLKAVILTVLRNIQVYNPALHGTGRIAVFALTGPVPYTISILGLIDYHPHVVRDVAKLGLYYSIFDQEGQGNEGHAGSSHYSRLVGQPVTKLSALKMLPYRIMRRWARITKPT